MTHFSSLTFVLSMTLAGVSLSACGDNGSSSDQGDQLDIDPTAPTVAYTKLEIKASPSEVWAVLVDVDRWTEWLPFQRASLDGPLAVGSVIRWSVDGDPIDSRLVVVDPERRLVWNGTDGAVHVWELVPTENGTLLHNNESIDDWQEDTGEDSSAFLEMNLQGWNQLLAQRVYDRIVSASSDKTVRVWKADGRGEPLVLRGHHDAVWSVAFSPEDPQQ